MTWTYNETLATAKDQMRVLLGDTNELDQQLSDEALLFFYNNGATGPIDAAASAALALATKYARDASSKSVGSMSLSYNRYQNYMDLYKTLSEQALNPGAILAAPVVGGISNVDKRQQEADGDRVVPYFTKHTMEIPGGSQGDRQPSESEAWGP